MKKFFCIFVFTALASGGAEALCIKDNYANLRSGPGRHFPMTWMVYQYMPFKVLEKKNGWYHVEDQDGDKHWVIERLTTDKMKCAVTTHDKTVIRTGPGDSHDETDFSPEDKNYSLKVIEIRDDWVNVADMDNDTGWIRTKDLWIR